MRTSIRRLSTASAALSALACFSCGADGTWSVEPTPGANAADEQQTAEHSDAITGGASFTADYLPSVVRLAFAPGYSNSFCTGTVIGPRQVLTASHCVPRWMTEQPTAVAPTNYGVVVEGNGLYQTSRVIRAYSAVFVDAAIVVTENDLQAEPIRVWSEPMDSWATAGWPQRHHMAVGYAGSATRRAGWFKLTSLLTDYYTVEGEGGETVEGGDSGGPDLALLHGHWYIVGIHKTSGSSLRADRIATWIRSQIPMAGDHTARERGSASTEFNSDVNGDGKVDFLVTTPADTRLYRSTGSGFTTNLWTRNTPEWRLGRVETMLGDLDGDGSADIERLTTNSATTYGQFTAHKSTGAGFQDADWSAGKVFDQDIGTSQAAVADFDGDGRSDVLIANHWALRLFRGSSTGLAEVWSDTSLNLFNSKMVVGDFTGDGRADVILQTTSGARWLRGTTSAAPNGLSDTGWNQPAWALGKADLVPGDFALGNAGDDLIVITQAAGTALYKNSVSCNITSCSYNMTQVTGWVRSDLRPGEVRFTVGQFGDRSSSPAEDVLITTRSGTWLYLGTGTESSPWLQGAWSDGSNNIANSQVVAGDWSGDGLSDLWVTNQQGSWGLRGASNGAFQNGQWTIPSLKLQTFVVQ